MLVGESLFWGTYNVASAGGNGCTGNYNESNSYCCSHVMFEDEGNMCKCSNEVGAAICIHIECGIGRGIVWHTFCKPSNKWPVRKLKVMVSRTIKSCLECGNKDSPVV